ncbi:NUDIX hydrolase [Aliikangiella coralliicola]|uniref:NUDIX hydrolase n=1 Tax=Aliikangiella coralliicola TaxID=2592383 RepID=A0A545UF09_9GAMM|nr:NUDIX domain-containing protein [Aliikangiella coralliicola]TQV88025.1 NUDIX hydrolase [Aliikangiella coralliicola]
MIKSFEKPILTVDVAYLSIHNAQLEILTIRRQNEPFKGQLALPGGYVHCDQDTDLRDTARRVIAEKTQLEPDYIEQVETVASNTRDPRGWTATVLFMALVSQSKRDNEESLGSGCQWHKLDSIQSNELCFDHAVLLEKVKERLIAKSRYTSIPLFLLPNKFSLSEAQQFFEITTLSGLEKKSFRRRLLDAEIVEDTGELSKTGRRKASLYQIKPGVGVHFFPRMIG